MLDLLQFLLLNQGNLSLSDQMSCSWANKLSCIPYFFVCLCDTGFLDVRALKFFLNSGSFSLLSADFFTILPLILMGLIYESFL